LGFSTIVKLLEGFLVMHTATVRSLMPCNGDYSPRWVTLWTSTTETVSHTIQWIWGGHTIGPSYNRWKG